MSTEAESPDPTPPSTAHQKPPPNSPAWLYIPCTSVPRAREFYTSIFAWSFFTPPGTSPTTFSPFKIPGSGTMGALALPSSASEVGSVGEEKEERCDSGKGGIVIYIMVEDVKATLEKVVECDGKVKQGFRVEGNHTELGSFWDTEGNVVGVLKWLI